MGCAGDVPPQSTDAPSSNAAVSDPFPGSPPDGEVAVYAANVGDYTPTAAGLDPTDIWMAALELDGDHVGLDGLRNITDRDGYDSQPSFTPDGASLYYVSAVDATQTEVFRFDLASERIEQVTRTPDASEFSPTFIPGQDAFSVTHEDQALQHLWRYRAEGSEVGPVFGTALPVGYHAWASDEWVAMSIVDDSRALQVGNAVTGELKVVAEHPGRSLHRIPGTDHISFVRLMSENDGYIERLDPVSGTSERLTHTLPGRQD